MVQVQAQGGGERDTAAAPLPPRSSRSLCSGLNCVRFPPHKMHLCLAAHLLAGTSGGEPLHVTTPARVNGREVFIGIGVC
jgi:hypothetical protein